jgi:arginase family enzyme
VIKCFAGTGFRQHGSFGFEEVLELMLQAGRNKRVKLIDITEFNPSYEDYNSSLMIMNMIYYYLLGRASR